MNPQRKVTIDGFVFYILQNPNGSGLSLLAEGGPAGDVLVLDFAVIPKHIMEMVWLYNGVKKMKTILHLCADIGSDSKPYKDAGYNVILIGKDIGVENYTPPKGVYGVIANPVCTEFSIARGFHKVGKLEQGMFLVKHCQRIITACRPHFWVIENPAT